MGRRAMMAGAGALVAGSCLGLATAAGADVVSPPGACTGTGSWQEGGISEASVDHVPSDVIEVPRSDTVSWFGSVGDATLGEEVPRREISGEVQIDLPIGTVTIDDWGGSSVRAANEGTHSYDLPELVIGIEMALHGAHRENGSEVCSGSVNVVVDGGAFDNPLAYAGLAGMVISGAALAFAGRATFTKVAPTFEDVNPG